MVDMYCSGCGSNISEGLIYCSKCGKRIADQSSQPPISSDVAKALGYIGSAGFFAYIFVVFVFLRAGGPPNQLIPISLFYFGALFGICYLLLSYSKVLSGARGAEKGRDTMTETAAKQPFIKPQTTSQLEQPKDFGIGSVTEHTTRTLDEVPVRKD